MKPMSVGALSLAVAVLAGVAAPAMAQKASPPYQLSVFAAAPSGLSAPDSIAVLRGHVFVGYGDGNAPDGSDGKSTQIVDFSRDGAVQYTYTDNGHRGGLKGKPRR